MGRAGFHAGGIHAQNIYAGQTEISADSNGDGSVTVTFPKPMKNTPRIVATIAEAITTGYVFHTSATNASVSIGLDGCSTTGTGVTVDVIAIDDSFR